MSKVASLLPPNATAFETNIESATARVGNVSVPIRHLWNPHTCPVQILPWLAWALSVDEWNSTWPESIQRKVIEASAEVHRHKGTPKAVKTSISATSKTVEINEWFQHGGTPFTFRADIQIPDEGLADKDFNELETLINSAKNVRSHLSGIRMISHSPTTLYCAAATVIHDTLSLYPEDSHT